MMKVMVWWWNLSSGQHCSWTDKHRLSQCLLGVFFCYWPLLKFLPIKFCLLLLGWKCWEGSNKWTRTLTCQKRVLFPTIILANWASSTVKHVYNSLCVVMHTTITLHMSHHRSLHQQPDNSWRQKETHHGGILITPREEGSAICLLLLAWEYKLQFKTSFFCQIALALCSPPAWGNTASLYTGGCLGPIIRNKASRLREAIIPLCQELLTPHLQYCIQHWSSNTRKISWSEINNASKMVRWLDLLPYENRLQEQACSAWRINGFERM